jgi:signal transduction histidine kinase
VVLRVEDDGRGIGAENTSPSGSLGVVGMRERAALLGGSVQLTGSPGGGTTVVARVPVGGRDDEAEAA